MKANLLTNRISFFLFFFSSLLNAQEEKLIFSKQELVSDFEYLYSSMEDNHPDLFFYLSESDYQNNKTKVLNSLQDSMSLESFYLQIAPFVASIKDGHTTINTPIKNRVQYLNKGGLAFPLKVNIEDERLFVSVDLSLEQNVPVGAELLSINEIPVPEILNHMFGLKGSEVNNEIKYWEISNYFSTLLWYLYRFENDYRLLISENDEKKSIYLQGITQAQFMEMRALKEEPANTINPYNFRIDSLQNVAFLEIRSFYDTEGLSEFFNNSFQKLALYDVDSLMIDVSGNGGGRSASVDSLMNYLTDKPYKQYRKIELRVSETIKTIYKERYPVIYNEIKDLPNGQIYIYDIPYTVPSEKNTKFSGKFIINADSKTYSAGSTFVSLINCLQRGIVIGHTGSPKIYFGDFLQLTLPNTKIEYTVSVKKFYDCGIY